MKSVKNYLLVYFMLPIVFCLAWVVLCENDVFVFDFEDSSMATIEFYITMLMELVTICLIPLALRLFKFGFVRRNIVADPAKGVKQWGAVRILMIGLPMMLNIVFYYLFMNVAFGYMTIIGLLCLMFVFPSEARCKQEMEIKD